MFDVTERLIKLGNFTDIQKNYFRKYVARGLVAEYKKLKPLLILSNLSKTGFNLSKTRVINDLFGVFNSK